MDPLYEPFSIAVTDAIAIGGKLHYAIRVQMVTKGEGGSSFNKVRSFKQEP